MQEVYQGKLRGQHLPLRIDKALVETFPQLSRRTIRRCLDNGSVYINNKRIRVASRLVFSGDRAELHLPQFFSVPQLTDDDILYRDSTVVVVNKPAGLVSQATRTSANDHLLAQLNRLLGVTGKIVHRLDRETSGVMIVALNNRAALELGQQFRQRTIVKQYLALCYGLPPWQQHEERCYLSAIDKNLGTVRVVPRQHGKLAITNFTRLASSTTDRVSLIQCQPITGRSHQLRAQLYHLGLPVIGDKKYGTEARSVFLQIDDCHLLHAQRLTFMTTDGEKKTVECRLPKKFQILLDRLDNVRTESAPAEQMLN